MPIGGFSKELCWLWTTLTICVTFYEVGLSDVSDPESVTNIFFFSGHFPDSLRLLHTAVWSLSCIVIIIVHQPNTRGNRTLDWAERVLRWRSRWHLGRPVWWCPARRGGLWGTSSSKPRRDTENSWNRYHPWVFEVHRLTVTISLLREYAM